LVIVSITRNPLYLLLILFIVQIINSWLSLQPTRSNGIAIPLTFIFVIIIGATLFNALTSNFGATVLFNIPGNIPLLSGPVTLEAVVFGAINGLILASMLGAFIVFNRALTVRLLIKMIPQAFNAIAIIVAIGITFLPITFRQFRQIRESQAIRGHRIRHLRDWLPLVIPLVTSGLERAMHLAEAMTARGFASESTLQANKGNREALLLGLMLFVVGWLVWISPIHPVIGLGLLGVACLSILGALVLIGRKSRRTTYKTQTWSPSDFLIIIGAVFTLVIFLHPPFEMLRTTIQYNPYPVLSLPDFNVWVGFSLFALLLPVVSSALKTK
jgi:energy-coupling factor transport system permease protein